ncbi:MAG: SsrA-binding protein SmpB [Bacilli bacterium]|jgi:SsrA-binding protein|nr:SsrA-binding protein SmpB [Bacilli bacterium]
MIEIKNKKAYYDYTVLETYEAGIVLSGTEVKSIRNGSVDLKDSYVLVRNSEASILNCYIASYFEGNQFNHEERRTRKLLLHKKELQKLHQAVIQDGVTLIPLKLYFVRGRVKILIGVCKGKKLYDKRETIKKRDLEREMRRS